MKNKADELLEFHKKIEEYVAKYDMTYIDAVIHYSEENDQQIEDIADLVTRALKAKVQIEAEELKMIKSDNTNKLPL